MSVEHYENFPVASVLCPRPLRPAVIAIYGFARTADDLADEGTASAAQRLDDLAAYRGDFLALCRGGTVSARWRPVFEALRGPMVQHALPPALFTDLLSAFEQDVVRNDYADRADLLDYCRRSANPVGRLLLHLYGVDGATPLRQSDAICTALQLINFWQDLGVDARNGRLYPPAADRARHGVAAADLLALRDGPQVRALVADLCGWARQLMGDGAPLVHAVPGRAGLELRLVVQGGLRILDRIEGLGYASLVCRPTLHWTDGAPMLWRALRMRAPGAAAPRSESA